MNSTVGELLRKHSNEYFSLLSRRISIHDGDKYNDPETEYAITIYWEHSEIFLSASRGGTLRIEMKAIPSYSKYNCTLMIDDKVEINTALKQIGLSIDNGVHEKGENTSHIGLLIDNAIKYLKNI